MNIAHVSMTPIAGAAWSWAEAFKEAGFDSFSCTPERYNDGRSVPTHRKYPPVGDDLIAVQSADVIFAHQGHPYKAEWYPHDVPTVAIYHSQPSHVLRGPEMDGWPTGVVGQYQTRLYAGLPPVPNLIPLKHSWYQPAGKSLDRIRIAFSPSNTTMAGWDAKGYTETKRDLDKLDADVDVVTGVSLAECLRRKADAHVVIDECVTGSYHRNSLEGLALAGAVVNDCDGQCSSNIRRMTFSPDHPFWTTDLAGLWRILNAFIARGPTQLVEWGNRSRRWMDDYWNPATLIKQNFVPLIDKAMEKAATC